MKKTCLLGWFAAALMLAACQNTVNTVENADKTMTPNTIADARFVTDGFLKDRLGLQSVTMGKTADGFKRVQLEVINLRTGVLSQAWSGITGENPYKIRYRFTWFDEDGMAKADILALEDEVISTKKETRFYHPSIDYRQFTFKPAKVEPLLKKVIENGERTSPEPDPAVCLRKARENLQRQLSYLDSSYKRILNPHIYKVSITDELKELKLKFISERIK